MNLGELWLWDKKKLPWKLRQVQGARSLHDAASDQLIPCLGALLLGMTRVKVRVTILPPKGIDYHVYTGGLSAICSIIVMKV